ncbi:MAG: glycosyltransferase [Ignavibacteriaceae bacterium]
MKKVLFITYYWPPSGKASLHWPLKIIKHLPHFGWLPVVLTVEEDTFSQKDETFIKDIPEEVNVTRAKAYEPFGVYKRLTGKAKDEQLVSSETISKKNKSLAHRLSIWIRMNLFIPDARIGWYFPAVKMGTTLLNKEKVDVIVSVGPPHSTHLVGKKLSSKFNLPHVPVFIDPWTDIAYYKAFKRNSLTRKIDNRLEKSVLENSKKIVFVTQTMCADYEKKYPSIKTKTNVLYWGFSEEEFQDILLKEKFNDEKVIVHAGNIFSYQNPVNFWRQLKIEIDAGNKLKLKFIGTIDPAIKDSILEAGLERYTEYAGFLPYKKMLEEICNSDYLLVCATEPRHVPGKLFEYLRAGKPIIAFGDDNSEVRDILTNAKAGMMFGYDNSGEEFFKIYSKFKTEEETIKQFKRKNIAQSFREILDKL